TGWEPAAPTPFCLRTSRYTSESWNAPRIGRALRVPAPRLPRLAHHERDRVDRIRPERRVVEEASRDPDPVRARREVVPPPLLLARVQRFGGPGRGLREGGGAGHEHVKVRLIQA